MTKKLILIGDSLVYGYGVKFNEGWVYNLSNKLNLEVINKGINGDITASMLDRLYEDVLINNPDYIFLMGGTNDLIKGSPVSKIIKNINEMIIDCAKYTSNIILGIPPCIIKKMANKLFMPSPFYSYCEDSLPFLREELIKLCNHHSIQYIDFYTITSKNLHKEIYIDGIHLNFLGNNLLLENVLNFFNVLT